jgi:hypothetical protein
VKILAEIFAFGLGICYIASLIVKLTLYMGYRKNIFRLNASVESPVFTGLNNHVKASAGLRQGFLHSFSLPDCIEVIQSGGQQTDCLNKSLCNDSTIIIGREARNRQMLKTVI